MNDSPSNEIFPFLIGCIVGVCVSVLIIVIPYREYYRTKSISHNAAWYNPTNGNFEWLPVK